MRVLVFGASITQGFWDTDGGWVNRLRKYYDTRQVADIQNQDEPTVFNLGISGDTVQDIHKRFHNETEARKFSGEEFVFIFSVGTNNAAEGMERKFNPDEYRSQLAEIIQLAKEYSSKIMLVGLPSCDESKTTPVFWRDVYYTNERIKTIEDNMKVVAENAQTAFVPLFDEFKKLFESGEDLFADGLHPNDEGHKLIANLVKPELDKLIT